jgi:argininosuccinate lyase
VARARLDVSPLGCGALATTSLPIDRAQTARDLGFAAIARNSLDAVSDRDFAMELCAAASITMVHLSRLSEDLVLWASEEFGFVALPDAFCTTSSLMPQKKNPDVPELVRGKTGRVAGDLVALLTVMKGLPLSYNRDMQEDKEPLFDALDTVLACLRIYTRLIPGIEVRADRCAAAAARGFMGATDLADHLVCRGVPFRQAHGIVGRIVARALAEGRTQGDLTLAELRAHSPLFDVAALEALRPDGAVEGRDHPGGPARARVIEAIAAARAELPPR